MLVECYARIDRPTNPEKKIAEHAANYERFRLEKEAEKDPAHGRAIALHVASLIASADRAGIRGKMEKETDELPVRDPVWLAQVSTAVSSAPLTHSVACLCSGWRTVFFYKDGELLVSVAAIHGNQLRIFWPGGGGDYPITVDAWRAVSEALASPVKANQPAKPTPVIDQSG